MNNDGRTSDGKCDSERGSESISMRNNECIINRIAEKSGVKKVEMSNKREIKNGRKGVMGKTIVGLPVFLYLLQHLLHTYTHTILLSRTPFPLSPFLAHLRCLGVGSSCRLSICSHPASFQSYSYFSLPIPDALQPCLNAHRPTLYLQRPATNCLSFVCTTSSVPRPG